MNAFDCAIKIEEETKSYYEGLQAVAIDRSMKNLFAMLAAAEEEHKTNLIKLKRKLRGAQMSALSAAVCSYKPYLTPLELLEAADKDPDLYLFAVKKEEEDIRFYEEMAGRAADEAARRCFFILAEAERRHLERVENIYFFAEEPKTYLESAEFGNLRGL